MTAFLPIACGTIGDVDIESTFPANRNVIAAVAGAVRAFLRDLAGPEDQQETLAIQSPLVVAVSGGPDSVALLHALVDYSSYPLEKLIVAHLNHNLRPEAASDAAFVCDLAEAWGLPCRVGQADVPGLAREKGLSLETAAREARYAFLAAVAQEVGAVAVATGHNQNDQAETVLMHLVRGSGLTGLRGMLPVAPLPGAPEIRLYRPLLAVSREQIKAYCAAQQLATVQDRSNLDTTHVRNLVRHKSVPALTELNSQIVAHLETLASVVAAEEELLGQLADQAWSEVATESASGRISLELAAWRALPLALRRRLLRQAVQSLQSGEVELGFAATELARRVAETGQTGDQVTLPGGLSLRVEYGHLLLTGTDERTSIAVVPQLAGRAAQVLTVPGRVVLRGGWIITAERIHGVAFDLIKANPDPWVAYVNLPAGPELVVRPRLAGERLQPLGLGGHSAKVGDLMTNRKIPAAYRALWPIVAGADHPFWLVGHVVDERARVSGEAEQVVLLRAGCR